MKFIYSLILTLFIGGASLFWFFPLVIKDSNSKKPELYLIPEEKKAAHLITSYPKHNQFLAATPTVVKLEFDKELTQFKGSVTFGEIYIHKTPILDESKKILTFPLTNQTSDGIYQTNYSVCFAKNDCTEGQFAYKIDISKMSNFSNFSDGSINQVNITIKKDKLEPQNILINEGTLVTWVNDQDQSQDFNILGSTFNFATQKLPNSDVLGISSSAETFSIPGEYVYTIGENQLLVGKIMVQKKQN